MNQPTESIPGTYEVPQRRTFVRLAAIGTALVVAAVLTGVAILVSGYFDRKAERDLAAEAREDLEKRNFRPLSGELDALVTDGEYKPIPTQAHSLLGRPAPDFSLTDTDGKTVTLSEVLHDSPVVLVFYYGYHCNHCVSQLFALNDDIAKFQELGARVIAISADPPELTRERYKKYGAFAFLVLYDPGNAVAEKYGTYAKLPKEEDGNLMHGTFVIHRKGRVIWANRGDSPFTENLTLLVEVHRNASGL